MDRPRPAIGLIFRDTHPMIRAMVKRPRLPRTRGAQSANTARAHLVGLGALPVVLERFGVSSRPVLREVGLAPEDFEDPERSATFADLDRLLSACVRRSGCCHFGLLLGEPIRLESYGIAGRLARNAPTVGRALQDLAAYFVLQDSGGTTHVAVRDGVASLAYGIHATGMRNADQVYDLAVVAMRNVMRQLCGIDWRPDTVLLPRSRPHDLRPYRDVLQAPLRFDAMQAALLFPARWLEQPIADADSLLHKLLADRASRDRSQMDPLLQNEVRRVVRELLVSGEVSRAEVARRLGMQPRTLVRRLHGSGTTYQELLDDSRAQTARQLLHDTRSSVARIAASLGYHDPTIFTRAFRRWTGVTPREFRATLHEPA